MKSIRKTAVGTLGAVALTAPAAPSANAQVPIGPVAPGGAAAAGSPCSLPAGTIVGGPPGSPLQQVCAGVGNLAFIGPTIGQIATVVGPTIIGPSVGVQAVSSGGSVVLTP